MPWSGRRTRRSDRRSARSTCPRTGCRRDLPTPVMPPSRPRVRVGSRSGVTDGCTSRRRTTATPTSTGERIDSTSPPYPPPPTPTTISANLRRRWPKCWGRCRRFLPASRRGKGLPPSGKGWRCSTPARVLAFNAGTIESALRDLELAVSRYDGYLAENFSLGCRLPVDHVRGPDLDPLLAAQTSISLVPQPLPGEADCQHAMVRPSGH